MLVVKDCSKKIAGDLGYTFQVTGLTRTADATYVISGSLGYNSLVAKGDQ